MNLVSCYNAGFASARKGLILGNPFAGDALARAAWQQGYDDGKPRARVPIMGQAGEGAVTGGVQANLWPDRLDPKAEAKARRIKRVKEQAVTELFGIAV